MSGLAPEVWQEKEGGHHVADEQIGTTLLASPSSRLGFTCSYCAPVREQALRASEACSLLDTHPRAMAWETQ